MENLIPARGNKILFVVSNAAFVISWVLFCARLIQHWRSIDGRVRTDIEFLMFMFVCLWVDLLFEKAKGLSLMMVYASFWGALALASRLI